MRLSPALRAAFVLTFGVILALAVLSYWNTRRLFDRGLSVTHTKEVRAAVSELMSAVQDGETGQRGYVITGDDAFLEPYVVAEREMPRRLQELRELVADDPEQVRRVGELAPHIQAKLGELRSVIETRRREGFDAAQAIVRGGQGKREMDAARALIGAMQDAEDRVLMKRELTANRAAATAVATFTITALLAATFIVLLYIALQRHLRERERLHAEERAARLAAETAVAEQARVEAERERLLLDAQRARGEAEAASRAKDSFLATVSHELRTPLSPILAWTAMLEQGTLDGDQRRKALETIRRCARAQAQLIEDLLDVSRIIAGKMRLEVRPVDLRTVIEAAVDIVRPAADAKNVRLQVVLGTETAPITGDPERLQQVVWNLLTNAVKFTPKGGRVNVVLERVNSHVEIAVSDTGQGIAPEFLPHVFERFQQADPTTTRAFAGLGLGLAIVRHIVEAHGGTAHAESPGVGRGSVFTVKLPLVLVQRTAGEATRRHPSDVPLVARNLPSLASLKILVVDDEPDSNEVVRTLLVACGADVRVGASAAQALEILGRWKPTLVITDIGMPGEDGYALLAKIRAQVDGAARLPVIALTAYASVDDRVRLLSAGFAMHVAKPIEPAELVAVVAGVASRV